MIREPNRKRGGFVLMMVLVALVLVGMALATTARHGLQSQRNAAEAQRSLQVRWAMISCQRAVLPAAEMLFEASDRRSKKSRGKSESYPAVLAGKVQLGDQTIALILADENAKANLNVLYDTGGLSACENAIHRLVEPIASRTAQLVPARPTRNVFQERGEPSGLVNESSLNPAFRSWGEVFHLVQIHQLAGDDRQIAAMTRDLSIHSSGRINVLRAKDEVILAACRPSIPDGLAKRLLARIRETTLNQMDLILEQTITNVEDRFELYQLLGTSSDSYSLWLEATSRHARQQRFSVQNPDKNGRIQVTEFSFE